MDSMCRHRRTAVVSLNMPARQRSRARARAPRRCFEARVVGFARSPVCVLVRKTVPVVTLHGDFMLEPNARHQRGPGV